MNRRFVSLAAIYIYVLPLFFLTATPDKLILAIMEISLLMFFFRWFRRDRKQDSKVCKKCQM